MAATAPDLIDALHCHVPDGLRAVGEYTDHDYELLFVRDDVAGKLTDAYLDQLHDELRLDHLDTAHREQLYGAGELQYSLHRFSDALVFHFLRGNRSGLVVSLDVGTDLPLAAFVETCQRWV